MMTRMTQVEMLIDKPSDKPNIDKTEEESDERVGNKWSSYYAITFYCTDDHTIQSKRESKSLKYNHIQGNY